jgi:hypothetical protein
MLVALNKSVGSVAGCALCNGNNGNKQRVATDLSFVVELKVFFFPWLFTGASSPSFLSLVSIETPKWNFVCPEEEERGATSTSIE